MSFAILRVKKHNNFGSISGIGSHVARTRFTPNANPDLADKNQRTVGSENLITDVKARLEKAGIKNLRKDGVIMIENMITASPDYFANDQGHRKLKAWYQHTKKWLISTYGEDNLVNLTLHLDEKTPHLHAMIVPVEQKTKGRFAGQNRLNAKKWTGGRKLMAEMQDSYAAALAPCGLERGKRGSKALHNRVNDFYTDANVLAKKLESEAEKVVLGKLKSEIVDLKMFPQKVLQRELRQEEQDLINQISILKREKEALEQGKQEFDVRNDLKLGN